MKKKAIIWNVIMVIVTMVLAAFYNEKGTIVLKSLASLGFVLLAAGNLLYVKKEQGKLARIPVLLFGGIVLCMVADIVIYYAFAIGAGIFAVGHIFYLFTYCCMRKLYIKELLYGIPALVTALVIVEFFPGMIYDPAVFEIVCIVYAFIIAAMAGKALANCVKGRTTVNKLLAAGSWIFFISDLMLVISLFAGAPTYIFCVFLYYPAQCIMSHTLFYMAESDK